MTLHLIQELLKQRWIRFGVVGAAATASYYLLGLFFVSLMGVPLLPGNALAYITSFAVSYLGQSKWTFAAHQTHAVMLPRFAIAQGIGLLVNSCIIEFLVGCQWPYELAMLAAIVTVPLIVYILCKYWVFRQR